MIERQGRGGSYNSLQDYSENQKSKQFHASSYSSINQIREENKKRQRMTMSMLERPNNEVMNSLAHWKERPYRWRRDQSEKELVADYHQRYSVDDPKRSGLIQKTAQMGPFYEKYIQKMNQQFVKDRVKRLKQTFEVARKGQNASIKPNLDQSFQTHNSSVFSSTHYHHRGDSGNRMDSEGSEQDQQQLQLHGQRSGTSPAALVPFDQSVMSMASDTRMLLKAAKQQKQLQMMKSSIDSAQFRSISNQRGFKESPLMRKSGFDLRQRLGRGDRTIDQMFPRPNEMHSIEYQEIQLGVNDSQSQIMLQQTQKDSNRSGDDFPLQRGSIDTNEGQNDRSKSKEFGIPNVDEIGDNSSPKIKVNLPDSRHSRKRRSEYQTIENSTQKELYDQHRLLQNVRDQESLESINQQQISQSSLYMVKNPHVSVKGHRSSTQGRFDANKRFIESIMNNSLYSSVSKLNEASVHEVGAVHAKRFQSLHGGGKKRNEDLSELKLPTPNTQAYRIDAQLKKHNWHMKNIIQDRLPVKDYKMGTHRNTLQKHVWKQPAVQTETGQQLVDQTLKDFYNDPIVKDLHSKTTGQFKRERMPPIDMAVLQQKAFQQFDLIMDAEMDINRQIRTRDQIPFGKDQETPKSQKRFRYSNINSSLALHQESRFRETDTSLVAHNNQRQASQSQVSMMHGHHKTSTEFSNQSAADLSKYHSKQVQQQRKLCKSCIGHHNNQNHQATDPEESSIKNLSQAQDRQLEDWLRGNYHVKLTSNLLITQDYHVAAGRTKQDFQNNYHEDGSKKSNGQHLLSKLSLPKKMKQVEAVIDTGIGKNRRHHHQVDLQSTSSNFGVARDETQIEHTVRVLHEKYKDDQSRQSLSSLQQSASGLQLMEAKPSVSSQGGIVVSDQGIDGKNQLRVSKEINIKMSVASQARNEVSNKKEVAIQPDDMAEEYAKNDSNYNTILKDQQQQITGANPNLYSIEQKISFLEPDLSEKIEQARDYQKQIGMFDEPLTTSARQKQQNAYKSSNNAFGVIQHKQHKLYFESSNSSLQAAVDEKTNAAKGVQTTSMHPQQTSSKIPSQQVTVSFQSGGTHQDIVSDGDVNQKQLEDGRDVLDQIRQKQRKPDTSDQIVQATITTSDYQAEPMQMYQGRLEANGEPEIKSSTLSDTQTQINRPMYEKQRRGEGAAEARLNKQFFSKTKHHQRFQNTSSQAFDQSNAIAISQHQHQRHLQGNQRLAGLQAASDKHQYRGQDSLQTVNRQQKTKSPKKYSLPGNASKLPNQEQSMIVVPQANQLKVEMQAQTEFINENKSFKQGQRTSSIGVSSNASSKDHNNYVAQSFGATRQESNQTDERNSKHSSGNAWKSNQLNSNRPAKINAWKSPFQAHVERSQAKKKMLKQMVKNRPSEMHKLTERSLGENEEQFNTLRGIEATPTYSYHNYRPIHSREDANYLSKYGSLSKQRSSGQQSPNLAGRRAETGSVNPRLSQKLTQSHNRNSSDDNDTMHQNALNARGETAVGPSTPGTYFISKEVINNETGGDEQQDSYQEAKFSRNQAKQNSLSSVPRSGTPKIAHQNHQFSQMSNSDPDNNHVGTQQHVMSQDAPLIGLGPGGGTQDKRGAEQSSPSRMVNNVTIKNNAQSQNSLVSSSFDESVLKVGNNKGFQGADQQKNRYSHKANEDGQVDAGQVSSARRVSEVKKEGAVAGEAAATDERIESPEIVKSRVVGVSRKTVKDK